MPQNTNLNKSPYFADFDPNDDYYKILFKPGVTVQTRELTNLQSTLQNQIETFGKSVYSNTIAVNGGGYKYISNFECVQLESTYNGIDVEDYYNNLVGVELKGKRSGVHAEVVKVLSRGDSEKNTTTLYINYKSSSDNKDLPEDENNVSSRFKSGEDLLITSSLKIGETVLPALSPVAKVYSPVSGEPTFTGSATKLLDGVYFIRGFFINYDSQLIILDQYTNTPSYRVGLEITESLVDSNEDSSLNDNAQGFSNYAAPGADRLKIEINLIKKSLDDLNDDNFIEIFRVSDGALTELGRTDPFSSIVDILARRTYDESGNYYVNPFKVTAEESLNDYLGNDGIYYPGQKTPKGETPSDDLAIIKVNPGKAYVKGYEISTGNVVLEYEKPRTTKTTNFSSSAFYGGSPIRVNNVSGSPKLGLTTSYTVQLHLQRLEAGVGVGTVIGNARVYDFEPHNNSYENESSEFNITLFDIQTYTTISLQSSIGAMSVGSHVRGESSGATGFVRIKNGANVTLYQVTGKFVIGETLSVDGISANPQILTLRDYSVNDIKSIYSSDVGFGCDTALNRTKKISGPFTIKVQDIGGVGVGSITSDDGAAWGGDVVVGDIIELTTPDNTLPVFSTVVGFNNQRTRVSVVGVSTVNNVCDGNIGGIGTTYSKENIKLLRPNITVNPDKNSTLYSQLRDENIAYVDTENSNLYVKRQYFVNRSGTSVTLPTLSADYVYVPFDEEDYLVVNEDGTHQSLSESQFEFSNGFKNLTITGLSNDATRTTIITTQIKGNITSKTKKLNRCSSGIVSFTKYSTPKNSSVTYQKPYGTRIEDMEISLNVPDAIQLHGVFESSGNSDPQLPYLTLTNLNSLNSVTSDLIIGELVVGNDSKAVAIVAEEKSSSQISIIYQSRNRFAEGEIVTFQESGYTAEVSFSERGDKNIIDRFRLDNGQRKGYYDIARIVRIGGREPSRRLKIIFDYFSFESTDGGDVITANSYDGVVDRKLVPIFNKVRNTDIVDVRPRVTNYTLSTLSPFEFYSRDFNTTGGNATQIMAPNKNTLLQYDFYLGRVDKLKLNKNGVMDIKYGKPSENPKAPKISKEVLDIATIYSKPYVYDIDQDIEIVLTDGKRYTMTDLRDLESRVDTLEYYTSLSLLELNTKNLTIEDADGLNRFKSGFFVDNFSTNNLSNRQSPIYSAERKNNTLSATTFSDRTALSPYRLNQTRSIEDLESDLTDTSLVNIKVTGNSLSLDYSTSSYISQPFASRSTSINPFNDVSWSGVLKLKPQRDDWELKFKKTSSSGQSSDQTTYMRSRNVEVNAFRLKPNTRFKLLFDSIEISRNYSVNGNESFCFPKLLEIDTPNKKFEVGETVVVYDAENTSKEIGRFRLCSPNHKFGKYNDPKETYSENPYDVETTLPEEYTRNSTVLNVDIDSLKLPGASDFFGNVKRGSKLVGLTSKATTQVSKLRLISDSNGTLLASIFIPDPRKFTTKFKTGTVEVELAEFSSEITPESSASANYTSKGQFSGKVPKNYYDPIAQTFFVKEEEGIFISSIDVYFKNKPLEGVSKKVPVSLQIREVVNGYPGGADKIIRGLESTKKLSDINISEDGTVATTFTFDSLTRLEGNNEYAIVLVSDSADYEAWISRVGETEITTVNEPEVGKIIISKQPSLGSLFRSQNNTTWVAAQTDDLKFNINICKFSTDDGTIKLYSTRTNILDEDNQLPNNPIGVTTGGSAPNDGNYMKVFHPDHGMYSPNCKVKIVGVESDTPPAKLAVDYNSDSTSAIILNDASNFTTFENTAVSVSYPGYVIIDDEIIEYTEVVSNELRGITREIEGTFAADHSTNGFVYKYEYNGVSLRKINKQHTISSDYPVEIDSYYVGVTTTFNATIAAGGGSEVYATRNKLFNSIELINESILVPDGTNVDATIRTMRGTSASGSEPAFANTGYSNLDISNPTTFENLRMIASEPNEEFFLTFTTWPGKKSITVDLTLSTNNENISPIIDLEEISVKTTAYRIDRPINLSNYSTNNLVSSNTDDPHTFIHVTERINLVQSANSLKVIFDAYKPKDTDIRVLYKIYRNDVTDEDKLWELFPGYKNLDASGNVIDPDNNDGRPDSNVRFSNKNEFIEHEFTIDNLPDFTGFKLKIVGSSTNQTESPLIRNLRGIALL